MRSFRPNLAWGNLRRRCGCTRSQQVWEQFGVESSRHWGKSLCRASEGCFWRSERSKTWRFCRAAAAQPSCCRPAPAGAPCRAGTRRPGSSRSRKIPARCSAGTSRCVPGGTQWTYRSRKRPMKALCMELLRGSLANIPDTNFGTWLKFCSTYLLLLVLKYMRRSTRASCHLALESYPGSLQLLNAPGDKLWGC